MRATDIIRDLLDLLDKVDQNVDQKQPDIDSGEDISRFKQIFSMLDNPNQGPLSNTPNEVVADIEAVTTDAGGGVNGPKHPDDIRVKDPRGYE